MPELKAGAVHELHRGSGGQHRPADVIRALLIASRQCGKTPLLQVLDQAMAFTPGWTRGSEVLLDCGGEIRRGQIGEIVLLGDSMRARVEVLLEASPVADAPAAHQAVTAAFRRADAAFPRPDDDVLDSRAATIEAEDHASKSGESIKSPNLYVVGRSIGDGDRRRWEFCGLFDDESKAVEHAGRRWDAFVGPAEVNVPIPLVGSSEWPGCYFPMAKACLAGECLPGCTHGRDDPPPGFDTRAVSEDEKHAAIGRLNKLGWTNVYEMNVSRFFAVLSPTPEDPIIGQGETPSAAFIALDLEAKARDVPPIDWSKVKGSKVAAAKPNPTVSTAFGHLPTGDAGNAEAKAIPSVGRLRRVLLTQAEFGRLFRDFRAAIAPLGLPADGKLEVVEFGGCFGAATTHVVVSHPSFADVPLGSEVPWHARPAR